ncbi:hypothetical protein CW703_07050 [Candidatus Bathyarchaeota archaeon]|nr:MAG: hypothetical protein CW703_07050 [Candidatus Bathyarchaeota archaeon]
MNRFVLIVLLLSLFLASFQMVLPSSFAQTYVVSELWVNPMAVNDLAVSKDGSCIVAVNNTGIYYFTRNNPNPKWWYPTAEGENFLSVAVSANGNYVVAGNDTGYILYFNNAKNRVGEQASPTWTSEDLGSAVERKTLDISDNGEYVVVGGTGTAVYYFSECTTKTGTNQGYQYRIWLSDAVEVYAVDMSSDGKYIAAGGPDVDGGGFVMFRKDARTGSDDESPTWYVGDLDGEIVDVAVSDDGYAVVAVTSAVPMPKTLYYWADASSYADSPSATWTVKERFSSVDMSSDGDKVVAGVKIFLACLHFWSNARELTGTPEADWVRLEGLQVLDVAISDDGNLIVATTSEGGPTYKAYFFTSDGTLIKETVLDQYSPIISMSEDGGLVAVGGSELDSLYVYVVEPVPVGGEVVPTNISASLIHILTFILVVASLIGILTKKLVKI